MREASASTTVKGEVARFVLRDVLFDVVRFPWWWYTTGTKNVARFVWLELLAIVNRLSLPILWRNLLKPMYGDYSRSGRIISLFMRLIVFCYNLVGFAIWTVLLLMLLLLWLAVLPLVGLQVVWQLQG